MHICYLDEAGCTGALPSADSSIQPVFVLGGVFIAQSQLRSATEQLLHLKQRFYPKLLPSHTLYHDWMAAEIKGSELRKKARSTSRNDRRFAYAVMDAMLLIMENVNACIAARVFIKEIGTVFNGSAVYTSTVQNLCTTFQNYLDANQTSGIVIADSRNKGKNANVSHSIFTQRFRAAGDPYSALVEVPTFGHSDNHAGLQLMDFVCSSLLFPIAAQVCCAEHLTEQTHLSNNYLALKERFGRRLENLQHRYRSADGLWHGGITLVDPVNRRNATYLFR